MLRRTLALIALTLGLLALPAAASARPLAFGVHTPDDPFGGSTLKVDALERDTGRRIGVVSWFQSWGGQPWISRVQPHVFKAVIDSGRVPLVAWEPWEPEGGPTQPQYSLARIAGGAFDAYIAEFGRGLRDLRSTVYVRPMHEMNGNWYPWSGSVNGNSPALFVRAWKRMVDIVRNQGATNVKWVFTPLNEDWPVTSANKLERYYPGASYVDVLAVDGYNWGATKPSFGGWRSFSTTFDRAYSRLKNLGSQPIWIAEVGSATEGGSKAGWVRDMFRKAKAMSRLSAIVWMDTIDAHEGDWRMRSSAEVLGAFRPDDGSAAGSAALRPNGRAGRSGSGRGSGSTSGSGKVSGKRSGRANWTLRVAAPVPVGTRAVVRWNKTDAQDGVERWRIYLNGKRVSTLRVERSRVLRKRMQRTGRYRWTVQGVDARGTTVVSASRGFRVVRRR